MLSSSIWPIDRTLSSDITPGLNGPGSNGNEGVLHILQSSRTEASQLDSLATLIWGGGGSYLSVDMQSMYSTASTNWATIYLILSQ